MLRKWSTEKSFCGKIYKEILTLNAPVNNVVVHYLNIAIYLSMDLCINNPIGIGIHLLHDVH